MNFSGPESASSEAVLIISDQADFARTVVGRWQTERSVPGFTLMGSNLYSGAASSAQALAIVGPCSERLSSVLAALQSAGASIICVAPDSEGHLLRAAHPAVFFVRQTDGWVDGVVQLGGEILKRTEALQRLRRAEEGLAATHRHATLGRYILEMRHGLNNCLTSVLGNAELLLLEPGSLNAESREQIETIHTMALRMHEVLQRFSSLESEMQFAEKESHSETDKRLSSFVSG